MKLPTGSEQALSLAWALEHVAGLEREDAVVGACQVLGIRRDDWEGAVEDRSWFIGGGRWNSREKIEELWNQKFARKTNRELEENVWHSPLWQLWLTNWKMICAANLSYLIKVRGRGTVAELAKATNRGQGTPSKWGRWKEEGEKVRVPPKTIIPKILEFFDLKPSTDLYQTPLFLGYAEIRDDVLRGEGKHYLNCLSGDHLKQAVDRLREESARQAAKRLGDADS